MVRVASACPSPNWRQVFVSMLPQIVNHASYAFHHLRGDRRQDCIQETIANAFVAFVALARRGKLSICYPTVLAKYAEAQVKDGRRVGSRLNVHEVLSSYAQRHKGFSVESIDFFDEENQDWSQAIVEDRTAGPFDVVRTRIDFTDWMRSLPREKRKVATMLAKGETTTATAARFDLSAGRISQIRKELLESWNAFYSESDSRAA